MKVIFCLLLVSALLFGCAPEAAIPFESQQPTQQAAEAVQPVATKIDVSAQFSDRDRAGSYDESKSAVITLNGSSATCSSDAVQIDGSTVTITDEGTYLLQGTLEDGQILVNADKDDKTQLVLDGVTVTNQTGAAVCILQADKVFVTLAEGSQNSLSGGDSFAETENNVDGVLFSKEDLTLNGSGNLTVTSPAGHGIVSKDSLVVAGGSYAISCANHGFAGKDSVAMAAATVVVTSGKDGIHAENKDDGAFGYVYLESGSYCLTAQGDGISAQSTLQIDGGSYTIETGGGSTNGTKQTSDKWGGFGGGGFGGRGEGGKRPGSRSTDTTEAEDSTSIKGIKAGASLVVNGGTYQIDSADDALHCNGDLTLTAGTFQIATGDDGIHADEKLTLSGGTVTITESYEGLEGLHVALQGGDVTLTASDDGINAAGGTDQSGFGGRDQFGGGFGGRGPGGMSSGNGSIVISGGKLAVTASGDGIDANGTLEITGGYTTVCGPTRGDTATLDYDKTATISGGTFIGTGAMGMAQTFSDSKQGVLAIQVGNVAANTRVQVADSQGKQLVDHTPALEYAVVIISTPDIRKGESYNVTIGTTTSPVEAY